MSEQDFLEVAVSAGIKSGLKADHQLSPSLSAAS